MPEEKDCSCAPGIDGVVIHNSWAHPEWECDSMEPENCAEHGDILRGER